MLCGALEGLGVPVGGPGGVWGGLGALESRCGVSVGSRVSGSLWGVWGPCMV